MGIDHIVCQKFTRLIDDRELAAGTQPRINSQDADGARWGREQEVFQVLAKYIDGRRVRPALQFQAYLSLNR